MMHNWPDTVKVTTKAFAETLSAGTVTAVAKFLNKNRNFVQLGYSFLDISDPVCTTTELCSGALVENISQSDVVFEGYRKKHNHT